MTMRVEGGETWRERETEEKDEKKYNKKEKNKLEK